MYVSSRIHRTKGPLFGPLPSLFLLELTQREIGKA